MQKYWKKFEMAKIGHSKFFWTTSVEMDWKKFGTGEIEHSEYFRTILEQNDRKKFRKV